MSKKVIILMVIGVSCLLLSACAAVNTTSTADTNKIAGSVNPKRMNCDVTFKHVEPGVRSELYFVAYTSPGTEVKAKVNGPGVMDNRNNQEVSATADSKGEAKMTWNINKFGYYNVLANSFVNGKQVKVCELMPEVK